MSVDAFIAIGAVGLFFTSLFALIWCIEIAVIRRRFTLKLFFVLLTAACIFVGFLSMGREAARRQSITLLEIRRAFYREHRNDFSPQSYAELMQELDAEAARLGVDK